MLGRRLHLIELGDLPWLPGRVRGYTTDVLHFVFTLMAPLSPGLSLLRRLLERAREDRIVDLCSGSAGPMPWLREHLEAEWGRPVTLVLTDIFPHLESFERHRARSGGRVDYVTAPVDATAVPPELQGARTLCSAFHHFREADALRILQDAARRRRAIGVFESNERTPTGLLAFLLVGPLMVLLGTPFIRPFRLDRLFWTYVVPLIPFIVMWDGVVSSLRTYSPAELRALIARVDADDYAWEIGQEGVSGTPFRVTYLLGWPLNAGASSGP